MDPKPEAPNDTKAVFRKCGTCSQTFGLLLDRELGHSLPLHERALSRLAGGIANRGHQRSAGAGSRASTSTRSSSRPAAAER